MSKGLDYKIWLFILMITGFGLLALFSASYENFRVTGEVFYDQLLGVLVGIVVMSALARVNYRFYYDAAYLLYAFHIVFLVLVLIIGRDTLGARRWLEIGGFSFQPSELTKLCLILMLARYFSHRRPTLSFDFLSQGQMLWRNLLWPFLLTGISVILVFKQPDLGTALLLFGIFCLMLFVSGLEYRYFFGFCLICAAFIPIGWHMLKSYQKDRLLVFLNPNIDPLGAGYTIIQSKIAVGSGQIFGKGWKAGTQNQLNFLPERHTDFIFSVIGEEWGLVGALFLILCYGVVIAQGLKVAAKIKDPFGTLLAVGIVAILSMQVIVNIGMAIGLFPVVGITLPFVSYGRSSLLIFFVMSGILLNLSQQRRVF